MKKRKYPFLQRYLSSALYFFLLELKSRVVVILGCLSERMKSHCFLPSCGGVHVLDGVALLT